MLQPKFIFIWRSIISLIYQKMPNKRKRGYWRGSSATCTLLTVYRFEEKEAMLKKFYENGVPFPNELKEGALGGKSTILVGAFLWVLVSLAVFYSLYNYSTFRWLVLAGFIVEYLLSKFIGIDNLELKLYGNTKHKFHWILKIIIMSTRHNWRSGLFTLLIGSWFCWQLPFFSWSCSAFGMVKWLYLVRSNVPKISEKTVQKGHNILFGIKKTNSFVTLRFVLLNYWLMFVFRCFTSLRNHGFMET